MYKRPAEIEEAIDTVDNATFDYSNSTVKAWNQILQYIQRLEKVEQRFLEAQKNMIDDGK